MSDEKEFTCFDFNFTVPNNRPLNIVALLGASGSGKTYIKNMILSYLNNFHAPLQVTTRPIRADETYVDYYFLSKEAYDSIKHFGLTARTHFNGNDYGTLMNTLVYGANQYNVIVVSKEGLKDIEGTFRGNKNFNLTKIIVEGNSLDEEIYKGHDRTEEFVKQEIKDIHSIRYHGLIHNEEGNRANFQRVLDVLSSSIKSSLREKE